MMTYDANKKEVILAYILWFFLGSFGVHRMYMNRTFSGLIMAALQIISWPLVLIFVGYIGLGLLSLWWIIDAFLIIGWVEAHNNKLAHNIG
ncbi:MAG: TM2 domain-containing protein [Rhizobiales bacterium]|nr:TM2 domain-containing protein [Hyphomicrobiales bacterium]